MLKTAEDLVGPYVWGQYHILVLPPSFPYGGMENPCLTFATPTLLVGGRARTRTHARTCAAGDPPSCSSSRLEINPCPT